MNSAGNIPHASDNFHVEVFVDISKTHLDYAVAGGSADRIPYRLDTVEQLLEDLTARHGLEDPCQLRVVCEPTGGYQHRLLKAAEAYGAQVHFVDTERMSNARLVTYGSREKTDRKDPGAMGSLWQMGAHRQVSLPEGLRKAVRVDSREYEHSTRQTTRLRNKIHGLIRYVFVDYQRKASFTFSRSGQALAGEFGFCPHQIIEAGWNDFHARMKAQVPRIRRRTLEDLWSSAKRSVAVTQAPDPRQKPLKRLYEEWQTMEDQRNQLRERLQEHAQRFDRKEWLPACRPPYVSDWMLVRLVAETGPLAEFASIRQLWNFVGLKLDNRSSGTYTGKVEITKKGSPMARELLYQMTLPLVGPGRWMHHIHQRHHPNGEGAGRGIRAMTCVMRKLLQVLWALDRSGEPFDPERVSCCESQYRQAS